MSEIKTRNHNQNCIDEDLSIHFLDRLVQQEDYRSALRDIVVDINIFNFNLDPYIEELDEYLPWLSDLSTIFNP